MDAQLGNGGGDEGECAEDEAGDAGEGEDAVACEFDFEDDEDGCGGEHEQGGVADGEEVEGEDGEEDHDGAERAGNDGAGDVEFQVDEERAADEQEKGEVGVGEEAEEALADGGFDGDDLGVAQGQSDGRAVEAGDFAAVEGGQELIVIWRDEVDEVLGEGFVGGVGFGAADGVFGDLDVAAAPGDVGAEEGGRVVFHFLLHGVVGGAGFEDGVGRAGVGALGHGGDVGGLEEEEAG